jgi:hypothetical protein
MQMADREAVEGGPVSLAESRIGETAPLRELCSISKSSQAIDTARQGALSPLAAAQQVTCYAPKVRLIP